MTWLRRALIFAALVARPVFAQDTARGVQLSLGINTGGLPGLVVLPTTGINGDSVRTILMRDLANGDRVTIIGRNADELPPVGAAPDLAVFAQMGAVSIIQPSVVATGELHLTLWTVKTKEFVVRNYPLASRALSPEWRMDVHRASDDIELWATGVRGISATRFAFRRENRIWTVDSDGATQIAVDGAANAKSPAWHPSGKYLAFSTLPGTEAGTIMIRDMVTGALRRIAGGASGMWGTPAFSPDGNSIAFSMGQSSTELFLVDAFKGGSVTRITTGKGSMNLAPSFSPDGRRVVFVSSRLRHPDVYIGNVDGSEESLLTTEAFSDQSKRTDPAWAPDGHAIAYQAEVNGVCQILIVSPNGRNNQALTSQNNNEHPFWAPDSRHIGFVSDRGGSMQLWVLDTQSGQTRQITHGAAVDNGAWSPPMPR